MSQTKNVKNRTHSRDLKRQTTAPSVRQLPAMPIAVAYEPGVATVTHEKKDGDILFHIERTKFSDHGSQIDAYSLRDAFLDVRTPGEARQFLEVSGYFCWEGGDFKRTFTWTDFQRWQVVVRHIHTKGFLEMKADGPNGICLDVPDDYQRQVRAVSFDEMMWLEGVPTGIMIDTSPVPKRAHQRATLSAVITVFSTLQAMLATIYVDGLNGVAYRLCARTGCSNRFEVKTKKEKEYCSWKCAHTVGQRRRRADARVEVQVKAAKKRRVTAKGRKRA